MRPFKGLLEEIKPVDMLIRDFIDNDMHKSYFEHFRCYHTYEEHLIPGLEILDNVKGLCKEPLMVELGWWYHDAVYYPGSAFSEQVSADRAHFECTLLEYGSKIAETVRRLVMATQHFKTEPKSQDEKIIHDIDLAVLGGEFKVYSRYEQLIRQEYSFVEEKTFAQGRLQVLYTFLKSAKTNTLYKTPHFQDTYNKKAIENIANEIEEIEKAYPKPE